MTFDATINLGHVLTFIGFAIGGLGVIWALKSDVRLLASELESMTKRLGGLETKWEKVADALRDIAVQEVRLNHIDRRIDDLQHGRGFVLDGLPHSLKSGGDK